MLNFLLLFFLFVAHPALAQDAAVKTEPPVVVESVPDVPDKEPTYSLAEATEEIERFNRDQSAFEDKIDVLDYLDPVRFEDLEKRLAKNRDAFVRKRGLSSWEFRSAANFKTKVGALFRDAQKVKTDYKGFLKETDALLMDLEARKAYFVKFEETIRKDPTFAAERAAVRGTLVDIGELVLAIKKARENYSTTYQARANVLSDIAAFEKELDLEILYFKDAHLNKNAPAFFESEFFDAFRSGILPEIRISLNNVLDIDQDWVLANRHRAWHFMLTVIVLFLIFRRLKSRESFVQLLKQPLGLALTATVVIGGFVVSQPILIVALLYWILLATLLLILVRAYPLSLKERQDINILIVCYAILQVVDLLAVPLALYRIFLIAVALSLGYYCFKRLQDIAKDVPRSRSLAAVFRILVFLFGVTIVAEVLGYHLLAAFFIRGTIKSSFLIFVVWNMRFLFIHLITSLIQDLFDRIHLARRDRHVIFQKIRALFHVFLAVFVILALTTIWGFYDTVLSALAAILSFGVTLRDHSFTVGMVASAVLLFYLILSAAQILCSLLEEEVYPRKNIGLGTGKSINSLIMYFAWVVGLFAVFTALGFELRQFAIIAGALSVGIGFGLQNIVNNFVSGLILLFERPIKVGDILDIDGQWGTVEKMGLRSTIIRSVTKTQIIIPNSDFVTKKVENLTFSDPDYRLSLKVGVGYGSDTARVREILVDIATSNPKIVSEPKPEAYFIEFGESALIFEMWAWTDDVAAKRQIQNDILLEIDKRFRAEGIEIPFPQRVVHLRNAT